VNYRYEAVVSYIKEQVEHGNLKPGKKVPSIRDISLKLGVSTSTVIRAYRELECSHILYSVPKSGYYIVKSKNLKDEFDRSKAIDFLCPTPDNDVILYTELKHCINQAIDTYKEAMFTYAVSPKGIESLRKVLAKHLENSQIFALKDYIYITSGVQQALDIFSRMPFPNGKRNVLVEQPTYAGMLSCLKLNGVNVLGIKRTKHGLDFNRLEAAFKYGNIKFFYTMPRFQNPTGFSYNSNDKREIAKLAEKYDVYIVEDDYLGELSMDQKEDPLYCFDQCEKVIYIKTYSKTLLPGLRVAAAIVPKALSYVFLEYKNLCDKSTSVISQGALEIFLSSGMFRKYQKKMKAIYESKMDLFREAYRKYGIADIPAYVPASGFFVYMELPEKVKAKTLVSALQLRNVLTTHCEEMFLPGFKGNSLRISVSSAHPDQIDTGVCIISEEIRKMLKSSRASDYSLGW